MNANDNDAIVNGRLFVNSDTSFNGNVSIGKVTRLSQISEMITVISYSTIININYISGGIFYITNPGALFTCNFTNIPLDNNRTFIITLIINTNNSAIYRYYCNTCQINGINTALLFNGGSSSINVSSSNVITQTFAFVNVGGSTPLFIISSITSNQQ